MTLTNPVWVPSHPSTKGVFLDGAKLSQLYSGATWTEGPVYFPDTDTLVFSDFPNHRLLQCDPDGTVGVIESESSHTNGNTRPPDGRRVAYQHLTNSVMRFETDGTQTILASHYDGKRLNSPNDVVVSTDGAVWLTHPTYGILSDHEERSRPNRRDVLFLELTLLRAIERWFATR